MLAGLRAEPHAHVRAEFALDVDEISKYRFARPDSFESGGFHVPWPLLSRAFEESYGIRLHDVLGGSTLASQGHAPDTVQEVQPAAYT